MKELNSANKRETVEKEDFDQALADLGAEVDQLWGKGAEAGYGPRRDIGPRPQP